MDNITEILERNAREWGDDVALVEIDTPDDGKRKTWKESELVESIPDRAFRVEMTWREFDEKANRFANFLLSRGFGKGDKIAILLMNCLEWLPIYFGVLKAGCMAVPLNFRYTADEIKYCLDLADAAALVFGPEFTGRVEQIADQMPDDFTGFAEVRVTVSSRVTDGAAESTANVYQSSTSCTETFIVFAAKSYSVVWTDCHHALPLDVVLPRWASLSVPCAAHCSIATRCCASLSKSLCQSFPLW